MPSPDSLRWIHNRTQKRSPPEKMTEPIVGYRVWSVETMGGQPYLASSTQRDILWPYRKRLETDLFRDAGIHAAKDAKSMLSLWHSYDASVAGEVYLWGQVREFTGGYTAEFAYPKKLFMSPDADPTVIMMLEDGYGVEVSLRDEFKKLTPQEFTQGLLGALAGPTIANPAGIPYTSTGIAVQSIAAQQQLTMQYQQMLQAQQANLQAVTSNIFTRVYPGQIMQVINPSDFYK